MSTAFLRTRRSRLVGLAVAPLLLLAACGDDGADVRNLEPDAGGSGSGSASAPADGSGSASAPAEGDGG